VAVKHGAFAAISPTFPLFSRTWLMESKLPKLSNLSRSNIVNIFRSLDDARRHVSKGARAMVAAKIRFLKRAVQSGSGEKREG
jgi:hypothetical protein